MSDSARDKAEDILGPSSMRDLESEGLRVVGLCRNCRRWEGPEEGTSTTEGLGLCVFTETDSGEPVQDHPVALASSAQGEHSCLETPPDFGCTQWERR